MKSNPIIESVPNFSEGRDTDLIAHIAERINSLSEIKLIHVTSDADHNRSVFTMAGTPAGVRRALLVLFEECSEKIDMSNHLGEHPRLGAVDVVPFIPLRNADMELCVAEAGNLAQEVWDRFNIPVYLYEKASRREHLKKLEDVRRGQYESIPARFKDTTLRPDFGDTPNHKSGASIIGARDFLLAFNVNLDSDRLDVARTIAKRYEPAPGDSPT